MNLTKVTHELLTVFMIISMLTVSTMVNSPVYGDVKETTQEISDEVVEENPVEIYEVTDGPVISIVTEKQKEEQEKIVEKEQQRREIEVRKQIFSSRDISYTDIDVYTDLSVMKSINTDQINEIIDYWNSSTGMYSPFTDNGQIFIDASKQSGLDPVYILAHAAIESAWGTSYYAQNYHNYFGIGAFDSDPDNAVNYSNASMREGIIEGAMWIARNYYNQGQTSLYSMRYNYGDHEYCTSTTWMYSISDIIRISYSLIS